MKTKGVSELNDFSIYHVVEILTRILVLIILYELLEQNFRRHIQNPVKHRRWILLWNSFFFVKSSIFDIWLDSDFGWRARLNFAYPLIWNRHWILSLQLFLFQFSQSLHIDIDLLFCCQLVDIHPPITKLMLHIYSQRKKIFRQTLICLIVEGRVY